MTPGMGPQSGLWNCAISALVQRSSGTNSWVAIYTKGSRLKARNSFRSRDRLSRGENATQVAEIVSGVHGHDTVTTNYVQF
ncbi:hypothetical protein TNCT_647031 [Trichonephila clavata]|uniref:Uncharacterized protein n=1 Tax=Trichonephila clavata TaxID=2740835 RepID=A0A8X6KJN0_TRICU|nr:hypothetical protein TNCT_647031 [Trichonephila clavata]